MSALQAVHNRMIAAHLRLLSWSIQPVGTNWPALDMNPQAQRLRGLMALAVILTVLSTANPLMAFVTPATGSFGYDIYDVVVNQILNGPIGFVGGVALIIWGATKVMTSWMIAILCVIAGTVIIKAQTLLTSLGALVP